MWFDMILPQVYKFGGLWIANIDAEGFEFVPAHLNERASVNRLLQHCLVGHCFWREQMSARVQ